MQPDGEQPDKQSEDKPEFPRPRQSTDYSSDFQRRPPLARGRPVDSSYRPTTPAEPIIAEEPLPTQPPETPEPIQAQEASPAEETPSIDEHPILVPEQQPPAPTEPTEPIVEQPIEQPVQQPQPQPISFAPPSKKGRSKILAGIVIAVIVLVAAGGIFAFAKTQAAKNNPVTVMNDALQHNLSLKTVQASSNSDNASVMTKYDFTSSKNSLISSSASINLPKGKIAIDTYGSAKNSFISYTKLPTTISKDIASHTKNGWIQIRNNGVMPQNVTPIVANLSDPRYQTFGPIIMGNFPDKTRQQLINFILVHKVYGFDEKTVNKEKVGNQKMFVYQIKPDVSYLKIASQSAAASEGLDPTEITAATDAMEQLRGAKITSYIQSKDHKFAMIKIIKAGATKTIAYKDYGKLELPDQPQTKLQWQTFAPLQRAIDNQTALTNAPY